MFAEAAEAPAAVARLLAANHEAAEALGAELRALQPRAVVTCARGSSDHAATYAKYLIETGTGVLTSSAAMSVSSVYATEPKLDGVLYLAISQSGRSPDLLATVQAHRDAGSLTVAFVNDASSPLAEIADVTLPLMAGPELSVAATKSYIASLAGIVSSPKALMRASASASRVLASTSVAPLAGAGSWPCATEPGPSATSAASKTAEQHASGPTMRRPPAK